MKIDGISIDPELIKKILKKAMKLGYKPDLQLPERAFKLGFEIGYHGHFQGVGSTKGSLEALAEKAEQFGLKKMILLYYDEGKAIGISKKATEVTGIEKEVVNSKRPENKKRVQDIDSEEFEMPVEPTFNEIPRAHELFKPLEVLPGVTTPKLFKMMGMLK